VIITNRPKLGVVREKVGYREGITELGDGGWYISAGQTYLADTQAICYPERRVGVSDDITTHNEFDDIVVGVITINCLGMPFVELKNRRALGTVDNRGMRTQPITYDGDIAHRHINGKMVAAAEGGIVELEAQECRANRDIDVFVVKRDMKPK